MNGILCSGATSVVYAQRCANGRTEAGAELENERAVGAIFRLEGNRLVAVREGLDPMLGSFDRDGDGRKETLLGQEFDRDITFGVVKGLRRDGDDFRSRATPYELQGKPFTSTDCQKYGQSGAVAGGLLSNVLTNHPLSFLLFTVNSAR